MDGVEGSRRSRQANSYLTVDCRVRTAKYQPAELQQAKLSWRPHKGQIHIANSSDIRAWKYNYAYLTVWENFREIIRSVPLLIEGYIGEKKKR